MEQVDRAVVLCCVPLISWAPFCQCGFSRGRCSFDVSSQCGAVDRAVVCAVCLCSVGLSFVSAVLAAVGAVVTVSFQCGASGPGSGFVLCAFVQSGSVLSVRFQPRSVQL